MFDVVSAAVLVVKTATVVLGGIITLLAARAYRRVHDPGLRSLMIGFAFVTAGAALAGVVDQGFALDTQVAIVVEGAISVVGFAVITYSLYRPSV